MSRTAFEGFYLARDEYDKELQQRRLVESRMETLKQTFQEQAERLALGDRERALGREERELSAAVELLGRERDKLSGERLFPHSATGRRGGSPVACHGREPDP